MHTFPNGIRPLFSLALHSAKNLSILPFERALSNIKCRQSKNLSNVLKKQKISFKGAPKRIIVPKRPKWQK